MDKINIKYEEDNYSYNLRVPENLNWFTIARFENKDGSVVITNAGVAGTIFATAKRAGLEQV